ncbi:hypothetical protein [Tsukamurella soli]|uniref:hypothetical protein n=1 Tax=Tsukamurella soli TaxID=644556 RepID=UPI003623EA39
MRLADLPLGGVTRLPVARGALAAALDDLDADDPTVVVLPSAPARRLTSRRAW